MGLLTKYRKTETPATLYFLAWPLDTVGALICTMKGKQARVVMRDDWQGVGVGFRWQLVLFSYEYFCRTVIPCFGI